MCAHSCVTVICPFVCNWNLICNRLLDAYTIALPFLGRTGLIIDLYGAVLWGEYACDVQIFIAPQNIKNQKKCLVSNKWNGADRLKRVLTKFEVRTAIVWRVNGCLQFCVRTFVRTYVRMYVCTCECTNVRMYECTNLRMYMRSKKDELDNPRPPCT